MSIVNRNTVLYPKYLNNCFLFFMEFNYVWPDDKDCNASIDEEVDSYLLIGVILIEHVSGITL